MQLRSAAFALLLCTSVLPGCDKVSQCNKLIDTLNKETTVMADAMSKVTESQGSDESIKAYETSVQTAIDEVNAVKLSDEKLSAFSKRYVELLGDLKTAGGELKEAISDPAKFSALSEKMDKTEKAESSLVDEVNAYCSGS
jgi:vacuolar-type H+-ATPase subunit I/STV1